jgi:hypothetical protein
VPETNTSLKLPVISFFGAPPFSFEELHSHFSPINVFLPAAINATMLQPDIDSILEEKEHKRKKILHFTSTQFILRKTMTTDFGEWGER